MPKTSPKPPPAKPVHEIRLGGLRAFIWKNDTDKGPRFNTTFDRSFREGEQWRTSGSFGRNDLMNVGFLAQEALRWIVVQRQEGPGVEQD